MSQKPVRLVPLLCARCRAPVPAQVDEVAWVCETCGQGLELDETPDGSNATVPLDVFFSAAIGQGQAGRPFWVTSGKVTITQRETYKGNEARQAEEFWAQPRLFYIPAWAAALDEIVATGVELLQNPLGMQAGSRTAFRPVVAHPTDLRALAEFMVMSVEAGRKDMLKRVEFTIDLQPPQLWVLP